MRACGVLVVAVAWAAAGAAVATPRWLPLPGAPEVQVDLASVQLQRGQVSAWLRFPGKSRLLNDPTVPGGAQLPRAHRTALLAQFDCQRRRWRMLAANAYDSRDAAIFMASVAQPERDVGEELAWAYDALCEAGRASGRL